MVFRTVFHLAGQPLPRIDGTHKAKSRIQSFSGFTPKITSQLEAIFQAVQNLSVKHRQNRLYLLFIILTTASGQQKDLRTSSSSDSTKSDGLTLEARTEAPGLRSYLCHQNNLTLTITSSKVCEDISPSLVAPVNVRSSVLADHVRAHQICF